MANPRYEPRYNNQINIDYDNPARAGAKRMANFSSVPANPEDTSWQDCIRGWDASFVESPCITGNAGGAADIKLFFGAGYDGTDFDFYTGGVKDTATYVHADGWLIPADPIYNIILNDGTTFPCSEGAGNYLHTVDTAGVLLIEGTTSNVWDATQNFYHYNITSGYNKVSISNGTDDYIDTGIVPVDNENWYWEVKGRFNDLSTDSWNGSFETNERFYWGSIPAGVWALRYKTDTDNSIVSSDTDFHTFKVTGNGKFYIDTILIADKSAASGAFSSNSIYLHALSNDEVPISFCNFTCYSSKIYNASGVLVQHLIPQSDGKMYDLVTETIFSNAGTDLDYGEIPALNDGSADALGQAIEYPYIPQGHNGCSTKFTMPAGNTALIAADYDNLWYDATPDPIANTFQNIPTRIGQNDLTGRYGGMLSDTNGDGLPDGFTAANSTGLTLINNVLSFTATSSGGQVNVPSGIGTIVGHEYYMRASIDADSSNVGLATEVGTLGIAHSGGGEYEDLSFVFTATSTAQLARIMDINSTGWQAVHVKDLAYFDKTDLFKSLHMLIPSQDILDRDYLKYLGMDIATAKDQTAKTAKGMTVYHRKQDEYDSTIIQRRKGITE